MQSVEYVLECVYTVDMPCRLISRVKVKVKCSGALRTPAYP